jgi:NAD(P)-dependent dehydrogenase (short-subunit alcohol dehydrogenase family)
VPGRSLAPGQPSDRPGSPLTPAGHTPAQSPPSPGPDQGLFSLFSLTGRTALVTGGSSGIGRAIAGALAKAGARVVIIARHEEPLADTVRELAAAGCQAAWVSADLADRAATQRGAAAAAEPFGEPDIVVSAAGVNIRPPLGELTAADWDTLMAVNLTAPFLLGQRFGPPMAERGWGRIINIASQQAVRAFGNSGGYGAAKAGLAGLTRSQSEAWAPHGVRCNAIVPGFVATPLTAEVAADPVRSAALAARTMIGRNGEPEDFEGVAVFLASRASDYITGQMIFVDGGLSAT